MLWECFTGEVSQVRRVGAESRKSAVPALQLKFYFPLVSKITIFGDPFFQDLTASLLRFLFLLLLGHLQLCSSLQKKQAVTTRQPHSNIILMSVSERCYDMFNDMEKKSFITHCNKAKLWAMISELRHMIKMCINSSPCA